MTSASLGRSAFMSRGRGRAAVVTSGALVDAAFAIAAAGLALLPWMSTFDGLRYLAVGLLGALLGAAIAFVSVASGRAWLAVPIGILVYLLGAGMIVSRAIVPSANGLTRGARLSVNGWKSLLTTVPPLDSTGALAVLPFLLGLGASGAAYLIARGSRGVWAPSVPAACVALLTILAGTREAWQPLAVGLGLAACAVLWASFRRRRRLRIVGTGASVTQQAAVAGALLALSGLASWAVGPHLPGTDPNRFVLRSVIEPPFDASIYPSPLLGFRKYGEHAKLFYDRELLTTSGLPEGTRLRLAVMDYYSGSVWSAGSGTPGAGGVFQKVGRRIRLDAPASTQSRTARITIADDFASLPELNVWVPGVGPWTSISFEGPRAALLRDNVRYNTVTGQGVVPSRLNPGDTVVVSGRAIPDAPKAGLEPADSPLLDPDATSFVAAAADDFAGAEATTTWARLTAIGAHLRDKGAYTDGTLEDEGEFWPGHSTGRLATLLGEAQPGGSDEQFAAAYALMANEIGMPTRVVLGAVVPGDGHVYGKHVRAWVEMQAQSGEWFAVPNSFFMPDRGNTPSDRPPRSGDLPERTAVPPPSAERAPGSVDALSDGDPAALRASTKNSSGQPPSGGTSFTMPSWVEPVARVGGPPVGGMTLLALIVAAARGVRRSRRRTVGSSSHQLAAGWRDLVDHARDLGVRVDPRLTRQEQARVIGRPDLAATANRAVFGPGDPAAGEVAAYWKVLAQARRQLSRQAPWYRRVLRPWNPRSFTVRDPVITTAPTPQRNWRRLPFLRPATAIADSK